MLKFIMADAGTFKHKRKQSQRACDQCRKRKKRCSHLTPPEDHQTSTHCSPGSNGSLAPVPMPTSNGALMMANDQQLLPEIQEAEDKDRANRHRRSSSDELSQCEVAEPSEGQRLDPPSAEQHVKEPLGRGELETLGSRFVGYLNPEGVLAATSPNSTQGIPSDDSIGIWLAEKFKKRTVGIDSNDECERPSASMFYGFGSMVQKILVPILKEECLSLLPPPSDFEALASFYFEKIHLIFPVINKDRFWHLPSTDPAGMLLRQSVCLAASMNFSVKQYLRLEVGEPPLSFREFGRRMFAVMRISIETGFVTDKIVLIQALALMSFFMDGSDGRDLSSLMCGRAVQYVHSLGLHMKNAQHDQGSDYTVSLFCCIWALDMLNAAIHGRPVLMHKRDFGRDLEQCIDQQEPCFQLLLRVVVLLDKVINIYRPRLRSNEVNGLDDFLPFEELLSRCSALQAPAPLLGKSSYRK
jgi:Fungal specific transcription factor domain